MTTIGQKIKEKKDTNELRRVKILYINEQMIAGICKRAIKNELPKDATIKGMFYTPQRLGLSVIIHSKEYGIVPEGSEAPVMDDPIIDDKIFKC
jgi:hypothetical protein